MGRVLIWGYGAAGLVSVTFHWHPLGALQAGTWNVWCYFQGRRGCCLKNAVIISGCPDVSILSSPPSCSLSSQSAASVTRTGLGWATTMLTLILLVKRVMKPGSRRPALLLSTEMKTTNVSSISLYLWDPFRGCCLHLFFALWRLAWLPGSVVSDWYLDAWS